MRIKGSKILKFARILIPAYLKLKFRPIPIWAHFFITRRCNLNCKYCFQKDNKKNESDTLEAKKIIDKLYSLGTRILSFLGGEPTIRKDFIELVEYANKKGMISFLTTNGTLLNEEYIERIGRSGLDILTLSVDSVADFGYSGKNYARSKKVLDNLVRARGKYGFLLIVNMVLSNRNVNQVIDTLKFFDKLGIPISLVFIQEDTFTNQPMDEGLFFRSEEEKNKLFKVLEEIKILKKQSKNIYVSTQYLNDIKKFVNKEIRWDCPAGKYTFAVDTEGEFMLCSVLPKEDINIFQIDKNYYKKFAVKRKETLDICTKKCLSNCYHATMVIIKNPLTPIKELIV